MYLEAKWIYEYTAHWNRLEDKLRRIEQSLKGFRPLALRLGDQR